MPSIDNNAAQFERLGNPWVSERERQEFAGSPRNNRERRQQRQNLLGKFPKVEAPTAPRLAERALRENCPAVRQIQKSSRFLDAFRAALPGGTREVKPAAPAPRTAITYIKPNALAELHEFHPARIEHQRQKLAREAEQARLAARQLRADREARVWAGFGEAMSAALGE